LVGNRAHSEWIINLAVLIDAHQPGFCAEALYRVSHERRQVIAAYLAAKPPSERQMFEVGQFLRTANHRSILRAAYGDATVGMRGALRRVEGAVKDAHFYTLLNELLSNPAYPRVGRCIARLPSLDLTKVQIVRYLREHPHLLKANVVEAVDSVRMAHDTVTAFRLLIERGVDETELTVAVDQVRSQRDFQRLWQSWTLKANALPHPVPATEDYVPILTGAALVSVSRRFQNCARRYVPKLIQAKDRHSFAEVKLGRERAVVHLRLEDEEWHLEGIFGRRNAKPSRGLRDHVQRYVQMHGVRVENQHHEETSEWDCLRRLASTPFEFDFDMD